MATVINLPRAAIPRTRKPVISSAVLATIVVILTEAMFFSGLISAFNVIKAQTFGHWTPPGDISLPVFATAGNTVILLLSGVMMCLAARAFITTNRPRAAQMYFALAIAFGAFFLVAQGYEWVQLAGYGLSMRGNIFGATFFLLIGSHAVHVLAAVLVMLYMYYRMTKGKLSADAMRAIQCFWLFVVAIWPLLYRLVYFS